MTPRQRTHLRSLLGAFLVPLAALVLITTALAGCNALEAGAVRRQRLFQSDISDRSFITIRWRRGLRNHHIFTYQPEEFAGAATSHGGARVYVGTGSGHLYCFRADSGATIWRSNVGAAVTAVPLVVEHLGLLFVGAADGALHAVDLRTGVRRWRYRAKGIAYQPAVYSDGVVYFANHRDQVFSLDARTGRWRWSYDRETPESFTVSGHSGVVIHKNRLYAGFSDGKLVCLGARGGETLWTRSLAGDAKEYVDVDATPVIRGNVLYASSFSGGLYALTADGGALRWRYPIQGASAVVVTEDRVYFASSNKGLHAMDLEGRLRWRQRVEAGTPRNPLVRGRALYVTYSEGGLYVVDRLTGKMIQRFNPGGGISGPPLVSRNSAYVLSNRGQFYAFTLR